MGVITTVTQRDITYAVSATPEDVFEIPFTFAYSDEVEVEVGGTPTTSFSIVGAGLDINATREITLDTPVSNTTVRIYDGTDAVRRTNFDTPGIFSAGLLDSELDRVFQHMQARNEITVIRDELLTDIDTALGSSDWQTTVPLATAAKDAAEAAQAGAEAAEATAVAAAATIDGFEWLGEWATATAYAVNNLVYDGTDTYICVTAHTSGVFATDRDTNGYWEIFAPGGALGYSVDGGTDDITINPAGAGTISLAAEQVLIEQDLVHAGDADTYTRFNSDQWQVVTGGSLRIDMDNSGVRFGGNGARITFIDNDTAMAADSATRGVTQQAAKGYTDARTSGTQSLYVPAAMMIPTTTNGATPYQAELATNDIMVDGMEFDGSTQQHAQFALQMPKRWDKGTITAQFIWTDHKGATGGISWALQAGALAHNDAIDTALGTEQNVNDTRIAQDDLHITPATSAITVAGTPGDEEYVVFKVFRDVADANDTIAGSQLLLGVKINFTSVAVNDA